MQQLISETTQNEAMLKGFSSIGQVQLYWKVYEDKYPRSKHQPDYQSLNEPLAKLYSDIIEYQAYAICHLSKAQLSRTWKTMVGSNDWDSLAKNIEKSSEECSKIIRLVDEGEIWKSWKSQLQKMQESQKILGEIRRILEESGAQPLKIYEVENEKELLQDLVSVPYSKDIESKYKKSGYENGKDFNPQKVEGTCEWFFENDRFRKWRDSSTSGLLWVTVGPGCGKSVLSRALIDERRLSTNVTTSTICYFFFKDGDERRMDSTDALCAILHQLFTQHFSGTLIKEALPIHKSHGKSLTQNFSKLWQILVACGRSSDAGEIVCILDALDECNKESRQRLIDKLRVFYSEPDLSNSPWKLKFLITSRFYSDLKESFKKLSGIPTYLHLDGDSDANSDQIGKEINLVIDYRLPEIISGFEEKDRNQVSKCLKDKQNRTYLWLHLTFDAIEHKGSNRPSDVQDVLAELSEEVSDKYEKLLSRSKYPHRTKTLLQIVLAAARPLTVNEANIALTLALPDEQIESQKALKSGLWPSENFPSTVSDLCGLFIVIHDSKLSFIHQTAREFLLGSQCQGHSDWKGRFNVPESHSTTLRSCLYYLVMPEISDANYRFNKTQYPFLGYAAGHWPLHFSQHSDEAGTEREKKVSELALSLCDTRSKLFRVWSAPYTSDYGFPSSGGSFVIAAYFGLEMIVKQLLNISEVEVNSKDENGRTAL